MFFMREEACQAYGKSTCGRETVWNVLIDRYMSPRYTIL